MKRMRCLFILVFLKILIYKNLKIELNINSSLSQIVAVLEDVDFYTQWIYSCNSSQYVKHVKLGEFYYYVEMDLPWPLNNRDIV